MKLFIIILTLALLGNLTSAATRTSTNYSIEQDTITVGGGEQAASANYKVDESLGEPGDSAPTSSGYKIFSAFRRLLSAAVGTPSLEARHFRFYVNLDALQPTDPWPGGAADLATDSAVTDASSPPAQGTALRLRYAIKANSAALAAGQLFKLQFGQRATTCAAISSWTDVGGLTASAAWRGYDNSTPADGAAVSATLLTGSTVSGTYEEENNSAAAPAVAQNGIIEHDWVLQNNSATAGATYCFRAVKAAGPALDTYSVYPQITLAAAQVQSGGGASGGAVAFYTGPTKVALQGITAPKATVYVVKDDVYTRTLEADENGLFAATFTDLTAGLATFALASVDPEGTRSLRFSVGVNLLANAFTTLSDIFLSPTLYVSQATVTVKDAVSVRGYAAPASTVALMFASEELTVETVANQSGRFNYSLPAEKLGLGDHTVRARAKRPGGFFSAVSRTWSFSVLDEAGQGAARLFQRADFNRDGSVNLTDFSILLANFGRTIRSALADINSNGTVDLADLSILLYEWTG